jgi:hypothetical protein
MKKENRIIYAGIILFVFILFIGFSLSCNGKNEESKTTYKENVTATKEPLTVDVKYIVFGTTSNDVINPVVSVTYTNSQGGTEQISNLELKENPNDIMVYKLKDIKDFKATLIAGYKDFPIDEFMYISAQNQKDYGAIAVFIVIENTLQKMSISKGLIQ